MQKKRYSRVYVEITNVCNLCCSFCHGTKREKRTMTVEELKFVLSELLPLTNYVYFHVMGEPTTHPALPEIIKYASSIGLKCAVTTNGTLLSHVGQPLIDAGVYKVNISVHSFEEGSLEKFLSYLYNITDFAKRASSAGVLTVLRLWNKGADGGRNDKILEFLKENIEGEWKWGVRGARIRHKLHLEFGERFEWPDMTAHDGGDCVFCYGLSDHFGILSDGSVIPCCLDSEGDITLGNIFCDDITDILSSSRAEAIREGFRKRCASEELCRKCGYARRFK